MSPNTTTVDCKYIAVEIPEQILSELKWLADYMDMPPTQALRAAIATQTYLSKVVKEDNGKILIKRKDQTSQFMIGNVLPDKL